MPIAHTHVKNPVAYSCLARSRRNSWLIWLCLRFLSSLSCSKTDSRGGFWRGKFPVKKRDNRWKIVDTEELMRNWCKMVAGVGWFDLVGAERFELELKSSLGPSLLARLVDFLVLDLVEVVETAEVVELIEVEGVEEKGVVSKPVVLVWASCFLRIWSKSAK